MSPEEVVYSIDKWALSASRLLPFIDFFAFHWAIARAGEFRVSIAAKSALNSIQFNWRELCRGIQLPLLRGGIPVTNLLRFSTSAASCVAPFSAGGQFADCGGGGEAVIGVGWQ